MTVDAERRQAGREEVCCFRQTSADTESARTSRTLCDVMLGVLGRDDTLRRIYVRRRWQGLVKEIEMPPDAETTKQ